MKPGNLKKVEELLSPTGLLSARAEIIKRLNGLRPRDGSLPDRELLPAAIAQPESRAQAAELYALLSHEHEPYVFHPEELRQPGRGQALLVDLSRLQALLNLDAESQLATVEVGVLAADLESRLQAQGFTLGYVPSPDDAIPLYYYLGGYELMAPYLKYEDLEGLTAAVGAATPEGRLAETMLAPRSATGPGFKHFFLGGRYLGAWPLTVTLRIHRLPETSRETALVFPDLSAGIDFARRVIQNLELPHLLRLHGPKKTVELGSARQTGNVLLYLYCEGSARDMELKFKKIAEAAGQQGAFSAALSREQSRFDYPEANPLINFYFSAWWSQTVELTRRLYRLPQEKMSLRLTLCRGWREGALLAGGLLGEAGPAKDLAALTALFTELGVAGRALGASLLQARGEQGRFTAEPPFAVDRFFKLWADTPEIKG